MPSQSTLWKRIALAFIAGPVKVLIIVVCIAMLLSILYTPCRPRESARRTACQSNLKQVALAALHYLKDNDTYPLAQNPPNPQWTKRYSSKFVISQAFQCPSDNNATSTQKNSYGYNTNLSAKDALGKNAASVILNFEVVARADNQTQTGKTLEAITAKERHLDGANYSFADGHAKWLKINRISNTKPDGKNATFAVE